MIKNTIMVMETLTISMAAYSAIWGSQVSNFFGSPEHAPGPPTSLVSLALAWPIIPTLFIWYLFLRYISHHDPLQALVSSVLAWPIIPILFIWSWFLKYTSHHEKYWLQALAAYIPVHGLLVVLVWNQVLLNWAKQWQTVQPSWFCRD